MYQKTVLGKHDTKMMLDGKVQMSFHRQFTICGYIFVTGILRRYLRKVKLVNQVYEAYKSLLGSTFIYSHLRNKVIIQI